MSGVLPETSSAARCILRTENLSLSFGGVTAVRSVSFSLDEGEITALIGPNGAGKTTLFNLLAGHYRPSSGRIFFQGRDVTHLAAYQLVRRGISRTFQNIRLFSGLTVLENLLAAHPDCNGENPFTAIFGAGRSGKKRRKIVKECETYLDALGLLEHIEMSAEKLPYGKQRLLEIARALATGSRLILLDEPGAGMNSAEKVFLARVIQYITGKLERHIFLIEHDMKFVMNIARKVIVLDYGEKIAEGTPEEIQKNPLVIEAYLGRGDSVFAEDAAGVGN